MCIAGISLDRQLYSTNDYQPLNQGQNATVMGKSSQTNPDKAVWPQKLLHVSNISNTFTKKKWEKFPALQAALMETNYSRHFASDSATYEKILQCQKKLREIDLEVVEKILALHHDESASHRITPELKEKIKEIEATADLFFNTLSDIRKSDRIIHSEASQKCFFSRRVVLGIALTIVGMALAATAFVLPIAIPALAISAPLLLGALRGLGLLVSCTDGSLNIRDAINKCYQKSKKTESIEFADAFSKLHDYLNEIKLIGITSLATRKAELLNGGNALLRDTSEQQESIQQEITRQLEVTIQPLRAEIERLRQQLNIQPQIVPAHTETDLPFIALPLHG
ncbi:MULTISPECIES: hypothetical protein [unclassified Symbiopectobacterium]|uniref:hypothetical protein n=1 Tax=unclassified Symbiopectobacterium TaxID=2794573 RepID=UPI002227E33B|nr:MULTISPECIES: hypothetical protein [unclassified Symbiopectobacterium]MCW2474884.1 hypothetical protein [Candidatus Symbiopectobacterium sp. NZEC151]MCW2482599.1 hypothetical protein [Candidatus Symbiopectobacterium sp. NZEC135]MCW2487388.1 hypothetical protein [Candidatus Symbiopectobacterium sp. NZEC127]